MPCAKGRARPRPPSHAHTTRTPVRAAPPLLLQRPPARRPTNPRPPPPPPPTCAGPAGGLPLPQLPAGGAHHDGLQLHARVLPAPPAHAQPLHVAGACARARHHHPWSGQCAWEEGGLWPHTCMAGGGCSWLPHLTSGGGGATGAHTYMPSFGAHSPLTYPLPRTDVRAHP